LHVDDSAISSKIMKKINLKNSIISILCILGASIVAILVHALMPSPGATINPGDFNSLPVKIFGFPVVASSYFIILYLHILIVLLYFGLQSSMDTRKIGLRFGTAFALIYLLGMQEVIVESSPFSGWGFEFVAYQFFMGLGDAIPVFILCIVITAFIFGKKKNKVSYKQQFDKYKLLGVIVIAFAFFCERTIGYIVGYIDSDIEKYPIPVLIWTALFGIVYGIAFILLRPIYYNKSTFTSSLNISVFTLGINWIVFNSFIGMIFSGTILQMLLRSGIDVAVIFITTIIFCNTTSLQ
jgi:hypothetical protein